MLNAIQKYKSQIEENTKQIAILEKKNEKLKAELAAYIASNPQELMDFLLNNTSTEPVPTKPQGEPKMHTVVSVKFNKNSNKTYDYLYIDTEPVNVGDIVVVETPYQGHQDVEVVAIHKITDQDLEDAPYDYKEARLSIMPLFNQ